MFWKREWFEKENKRNWLFKHFAILGIYYWDFIDWDYNEGLFAYISNCT